MISFEVNDMTCGHCVATITRALKDVDSGANVSVDLARHRVTIDRATVDGQTLREVIAEAGYTPVPV